MKLLKLNKIKFFLILNFVWAFPFVLLLRLFNKFFKFQIIKIRSDRFGHFVPDGAEQVARYQMKSKYIRFYIFDWFICNKKWAKMLESILPVYKFLRSVYFWNQYLPGNNNINQIGTNTSSRDTNLLFKQFDVKIPFLQSDNKLAIDWLEKKGWKKDEPFYCLLIRDNAYLRKTFQKDEIDWSYHDYRNSYIDSYNKAITWLVKQGIWVIRMGKVAEQRLNISDNRIIDYPFDKDKNDILDTWLFANCYACISTGTGPDLLSAIYGKNVLFLNFLPLFSMRSDLSSITYPKTLIWRKNNKEFTLEDHLFNNRLDYNLYKKDKIKVVDMTEDQILNATKEFYYYNLYNKVERKRYKIEQEFFWKKLMKINNDLGLKVHNKIHPNANISNLWLRNIKN